ncbi:MAG: hypothetical protein Q9216_004600 [Gyalolechia sp. 2 TL-2023]
MTSPYTPVDPATINPSIHPEMYENRSGHVVAAAVICLTLPTVAVILRFLSRRISRAGFWIDDYVVVVAMILSWGPNIVNLLAHPNPLESANRYTPETTPHRNLHRRLDVSPNPVERKETHGLTDPAVSALSASSVSSSSLKLTNPTSPVDLPPGNYVPAACWTAAEPSIAVVSACLPSLRPLFARLIWRRREKQSPNHRHSLTSWRSAKKQVRSGSTQGSFNRLNEFSSHEDGGGKAPWKSNSVAVFGGVKGKRGSGGGREREDVELDDQGSEADVPLGRIRAKTEVVLTVSDRVDWRDDLF